MDEDWEGRRKGLNYYVQLDGICGTGVKMGTGNLEGK